MDIIQCGCYIGVAIIAGIIFSLFFIRMDKQWKSVAVSATGIPIVFVILKNLNTYFELTNKESAYVICSFSYIVAFIFTIVAVMYLICRIIKKQTEKVRIRILDILLGYSNYLKSYYESRQKEIDKDLNYEELKKLKESLEDREKSIEKNETIINEQIRNGVYMKLPIDYKLPIDNNFVACIPTYSKSLIEFSCCLNKITDSFISKHNDKTDNFDFLLGYLSSICININTVLFDTTTNNVRTHIRIKNGDVYTKLMAFVGQSSFDDNLTDIPVSRGMIKYAYENKCSLVKSINPTLHHKANNDSQWVDYITFTIPKICENNVPLLSMGISISNEVLYNRLLYFINFCKIEQIIADNISRIDKICNINNIIKEHLSEERKENVS